MNRSKKLRRSTTDVMIQGVCAGLAEYLDINPAWVRLAFLLSAFCGGIGLLLYACGFFLMPVGISSESDRIAASESRNNQGFLVGGILIFIGIMLLLDRLDIFEWRWMWRQLSWRYILPLTFIGIGVFLIAFRKTRFMGETVLDTSKIHRGKGKIFGVCAGIARAWDKDETFIRMAWLLMTFLCFPLGVLAYIVLAIILPVGLPETKSSAAENEAEKI